MSDPVQSPAAAARSAIWNGVACGSIAYEQERARFARTIRGARAWMTVDELCEASGLDEATVLRFLGEID